MCGAKSNFLLQAVTPEGGEVVKTVIWCGANSSHFFTGKVKLITIL